MGFMRPLDDLRWLCHDFRLFWNALLEGLKGFSTILECFEEFQRVCRSF